MRIAKPKKLNLADHGLIVKPLEFDEHGVAHSIMGTFVIRRGGFCWDWEIRDTDIGSYVPLLGRPDDEVYPEAVQEAQDYYARAIVSALSVNENSRPTSERL